MPQKLKIILGVLVLAAAFLVIRVGSSFYKSAKTAALLSQTITTPVPEENLLTKDSDGDGLSDQDEIIYGTNPFEKDTDGDGYVDGEEVSSGYDPLDPYSGSPTTKGSTAAIAHSANLTTRLLTLGMASLTGNDGIMDPNEMDSKKFADIMQSINNEAFITLGGTFMTDSDIKIIDDNSAESIKKYLKSVTQIVEEGIFSASSGIVSGVNSGQILGITTDGLNYYESKYNSLMVLEVPSSWKEIHKQVLVDLSKLSNSTKALSNQSIEDDPVMASFALSQLQESFLELHDVLNQALNLARSQKIPIEDSILQSLQLAK